MSAESDAAGADSGVHICYIVDERSMSARLLGTFTHAGLARGQRVMWLVDSRGEGPLAGLAGLAGGDGAALEQLEVSDAESVYLDGGSFDPDRMIERYRAEVEASRAAGYTGLRVVADTSWLVERPSDLEAFVSYETRVNELFSDGGFAAVCHYDPERLPLDWLRAVRDAHPMQAQPGPDAAISAGNCQIWAAADGRLSIAGELDCCNAASLRALLGDYAAGRGDVHLDASRLRFVDATGTRALLDAARSLGARRRLIVHNGPGSLRVVLKVMGWADANGLVMAGPQKAETRPPR